MAHFKATNSKDPRANFEYGSDGFYQFCKSALIGIKMYGWDCWFFEGGGIELDPIDDMKIPEDTRLMGWDDRWSKKSASPGPN